VFAYHQLHKTHLQFDEKRLTLNLKSEITLPGQRRGSSLVGRRSEEMVGEGERMSDIGNGNE
jgi:hypothetical protein